ncbi:MAG: arylsulfatase [Verrucomicrobia bacterium]|nr:arylsulfatase [Verrucomicrobiota bacterium]
MFPKITFVLALVGLLIANALSLQAADKPNIIVIMADDVGYSDIGSYGGEIKTPNLDALAKNGVRFTQFYNTARCCPTRASLLTGLYSHQTGIGHMNWADNGHEGYRGNLNNRCATIAEVLRPSGYRTYMSGKWHVTRFAEVDSDQSQWPLQRGFEKYYGTLKGSGSFFDPVSLCRQNTFITPENDPQYKPKEYYYTDAISDNAVTFLQQHEKESADKPFFMYVAYTAAHWPMHALPQDIKKYEGKYDAGYEPIRQERLKRMKEMGLIDPNWKPAPTVGDWSEVQNKEWEAAGMQVFAAMMDSMDQGIGRIVNELKRSGRLDNTVIFYLQDNGGCAENNGRATPRQPSPKKFKPMGPDDLQIAKPKQTRDGRPVRQGPGAMPGPDDTFIAYGENWANVSNTPFREYKHWVHEGGISTPLIVHWPKGISPKRNGKLESQPGHLIDIMATCLDLSDATYPKELRGEKIKPVQGVSLLPAINGKPLKRKAPLFWEHESNRAIRDGKWKLVAKANAPWELYDMEADRTEMNNLATQQPQKVKELAAKWDGWAARSDVLPLGGWNKQ